MSGQGRTVAVIPARGGSKRIPRKNIRNFHGKPLIEWTINTLLACSSFDEIVVSTDDQEIASIAEAAGAGVPFLRPPALSDDHTGTGAVVRHAIEELETVGDRLTHLCLVYPSAVFVTADDLEAAKTLLAENDVDYVFSVTSFGAPIQRALDIASDGRTTMRWPEHLLTRSQDLRESFHDAGQFYWGKRDAWVASKPVMASPAIGYPLNREHVQDIDTEQDWRRAEAVFQLLMTSP